ncbi:hypothetical protein [Geochorda subterranea]|uniref:Capsule assembly protein Wzi n=1 Tax=Geochorda subterranea TaxID=3109564 RepID=A0ABZ1BSF3_9FIRM|nr:hypothetical protein [Limnochorda sp. LNt]WRP15498.1 hypothetical protein VLY81_04860 [Limnochorda sp. LNt]
MDAHSRGRLGERWPAAQEAARGPEHLEPRAGFYTGVRLCTDAGPWRWALGVAADGLHVPFRQAHGVWEPAALGLHAAAGPTGRLDTLWVEYGTMAAGATCDGSWAGPPLDQAAAPGGWRVWVGRRPLEMAGALGSTEPPTGPGVDQLGIEWTWGPWRYRKALGRLSPGERYVSVHRLYLGPLDGWWGRVGLSFYELGVVSPRFAALPVTWLPLWPGYLTQDLELGGVGNNDANFYMGLAARLERPAGWVRAVDAELLVDDMPQVPWKRQVYQLGAALRFELGDRLDLCYSRTHNYVITFQEPSLSLLHQGRPLAYPEGPDVEAWELGWRLSGHWRLSLEWRRRGEGRIGDAWEWEPSRLEAGKAREFLAGTVEHALLVGVEGRRGTSRWVIQAGPVWDTAGVAGARSLLAGIRLSRSI